MHFLFLILYIVREYGMKKKLPIWDGKEKGE